MQKILAIDDKMDNLVTLSALLKNLMPGCTVITAQSGKEGIEKAGTELPDAILLDIKMPDMDGFETCRRLKADERTKQVPVIMITAIKTDPQSRIKGLEIGADAFLAKPIDEHELVSQVKVALRIKKAEDALKEKSDSLEKTVQERTVALQESEEKYRILFDTFPQGITVSDNTGRIVESNAMAEKLLGIPNEDQKVRRIDGEQWRIIRPDGSPMPADEYASVRALQEKRLVENVEMGIVKPDAGITWINVTAAPLNLEKYGAVITYGDISDRKRAEEALLKQTAIAQTFMDALPCVALLLRAWTREIVALNRAAREAGARLGATCFESWPKIEGACHFCRAPELWGTGKAQTIEIESIGVFWEAHWVPVSEDLYLHYALDITDRKRAEEEKQNLEERLQRAEKMEALGQLAGGVAHDLNNVLGIMSGYSELLLEEIPEGSRSRGHAEKILQSTEKGAAIIQDLLTLARRGVTVSDVINLNNVVSGFLKTPVYQKIKDFHPGVTFWTHYDGELMNIKGSSIHIEKTVMNLVSNAAESISGKGAVRIKTESRYLDKALRGYDEIKEGDYAVLTVSDTGMGIPSESIEKIFEPFYTKKKMGRSGTGLGLAIVWGTVKDHNGYIDVQTEVGKGTTFTLYFPVTREELIAQQQKAPIESYMGNGESVLVVDDIAEQRDVAARLLTRLGYEVHAVSSGEDAVEYLKGNKADILVLDMIMAPGIDGLETYQRVLEIHPHQKAIIVSGFSETERVREAQKLGAGAYVKKPYIMEKIGVAVRDELNR